MGKIEDLERLQQLKENGMLTDEEFEKEKKLILSETPQNTSNNVNKKAKPKRRLKEKRKQILCTIGIISLFLVGLYGATRNQINDLIAQHRLNSSTSSSSNTSTTQKEAKNKTKEQKFKLKYEDVYEAIMNTRTLEGTGNWQYTDTSRYSSFEINPFSGGSNYNERHSAERPGKYATYDYIEVGKIASMSSSEINILANNIASLISRKSPTGGKYDVLGANKVDTITVPGGKESFYIMTFVPQLNIETNKDGIVTSISFCSSIVSNNEQISYKSYPYEQAKNMSYFDSNYIPQFTYIIDISDVMNELNYKASEFDVTKDFTIETKYTDIEFYAPQKNGSLELEYTSKTGVITTIKFN